MLEEEYCRGLNSDLHNGPMFLAEPGYTSIRIYIDVLDDVKRL